MADDNILFLERSIVYTNSGGYTFETAFNVYIAVPLDRGFYRTQFSIATGAGKATIGVQLGVTKPPLFNITRGNFTVVSTVTRCLWKSRHMSVSSMECCCAEA